MEQLADRLGKLSRMADQARQDEKTAQQMRERAEELLDRATPEERRRLEELAKQLGREPGHTSPNPSREDDRRPGDAGDDQGQDSPGGGPAGSERGDRRQADPTTPEPWAGEESIDARAKPESDALSGAKQREAARWTGDAPGRGEMSAAGASTSERARQAARGFERAIEQQAVPGAFADIVRRVQKRYAQRGTGTTAPTDPGRVVDAPDAVPSPR